MEKLTILSFLELIDPPQDGSTHSLFMMMEPMTTGLLFKSPMKMFRFSNFLPKKTYTEREEFTISMVMVLKTTSRDQEMNSMTFTIQIDMETLEMIFIIPITVTFQDIS